MTSGSTLSPSSHFFISYTSTDAAWAEWIAWQLEAAGYTTTIQAWDFKSGGVFPGDMHRALQQSHRVIALLSPAYMASAFCAPEWQAAFANDPTGEKGLLVCVRIADFKPDGLLRGRTYIDLVGKEPAAAAAFLLQQLKPGRGKPATAPPHPEAMAKVAWHEPAFPKAESNMSFRHNLPAVQRFFGREQELARLRADLEAPGWGALIDGPGGIGKTSLAIRAAELAAPGRFDDVLFLSAKQSAQDPHGRVDESSFALGGFTPMLDAIARRLDRPEITQAADDQRCRLVCEMLSGKRVLFVLDNLEALSEADQRQLATFLHHLPRGCKALLTSRTFLNHGGRRLPLAGLTQAAALQTLADIAQGHPALAAATEPERLRLFTETGGNTLLMTWTAGQVGSDDRTTIADALAHLRSCPPGNDPLEFIFGDLLARFSDEEVKVVATLSYPTEPIPLEAIAEISGLPEAVALRAVTHLSNLSVVVSQGGTQAYGLVPMVADFLQRTRPEIIAKAAAEIEQHAAKLRKLAVPLRLYFDSELYTSKEITELVGYFSDYYWSLTGDHLVIESHGSLEESNTLVPQEA